MTPRSFVPPWHVVARVVALHVAVVVASEIASRAAGGAGPAWPVLAGYLCVLCCVGVGTLAGAWLPRASRWANAVHHAGLGAVALAWFTCGLATVGAYRPDVLTAVLLLGCAGGAWVLLRARSDQPALVEKERTRSAWRRWTWLMLPMLLLPLLTSAVPTFYYDALVYHLAIPDQMLRAGGFVELPGLIYVCFPLLVDILNGYGIAVDGTGVASGTFNALFGVGTMLAVGPLYRSMMGPTGGVLGLVLLGSSSLLALLTGVPSNDMPLVFFTALSADAAWRWHRRRGDAWLLQAALMAGAAFFTKNVGALTTVAMLPVVITLSMRTRGESWRRILWACTWTGTVAVAVNLPTWIRNMVFTGNPVMPALWGLLGGRNWSVVEAQTFTSEMRTAPRTLMGILEIPWVVVKTLVVPAEVLSRDHPGMLVPLGGLAALMAQRGAMPARRTLTRGLWLLWCVQMFTWGLSFRTERFLGPGLITLCALGGHGLAVLVPRFRGVRPALPWVMGVGMLMNLPHAVLGLSVWQPAWPEVLAGTPDRHAYVAQHAGYVQVQEAARAVLREGEVVLMLGEGRTFHLKVPSHPVSAMNMNPLLAWMRAGTDDDGLLRGLRELHVGAILLRPGEMGRLARDYRAWQFTEDERARLTNFLRTRTRLVMAAEEGRTLLFQLEDPRAADPVTPAPPPR